MSEVVEATIESMWA